jgi:hypothetical protein
MLDMQVMAMRAHCPPLRPCGCEDYAMSMPFMITDVWRDILNGASAAANRPITRSRRPPNIAMMASASSSCPWWRSRPPVEVPLRTRPRQSRRTLGRGRRPGPVGVGLTVGRSRPGRRSGRRRRTVARSFPRRRRSGRPCRTATGVRSLRPVSPAEVGPLLVVSGIGRSGSPGGGPGLPEPRRPIRQARRTRPAPNFRIRCSGRSGPARRRHPTRCARQGSDHRSVR